MSPLVAVKLSCLVTVFVATMLAGISPYFMRWSHAFLTLGIQFAGGVFMSTALLHFLHDSNKTFQEVCRISYPIAFMLAVCGYLLTQVGDQTARDIEEKRKSCVQLVSSSFEFKEDRVDDSRSAAEPCKSNGESLKFESVSAPGKDVRTAEGSNQNFTRTTGLHNFGAELGARGLGSHVYILIIGQMHGFL